MQKFLIVLLIFLSIPLCAQEKQLEYNEESLVSVIKDLEEKYTVRFSFNSEILQGKTLTYSGKVSLEQILNVINKELFIKAEILNDSDIILKKDNDAELFSKAFSLDEVLLNAEYLTVGFDKNETDGSIKVSPAKLGILPGLTEPDVLQSLQMLPGIFSPGESASDIHIRGGTPDQNLILWDGIKMYHQGHFFGQISAFNPYITETINVFRSGTSARYGDRVSGVIDIRSSEKPHDSLEVGLGINLVQTDVFVKLPIVKNKLSLTASARRSYSDILNTITFQKMSNKVFQNSKIDGGGNNLEQETEFQELENKFYFTDYNTKIHWQPNDKHDISFSSLWVTNKLDFRAKQTTRYEGFDPLIVESQDELDLSNKGFNFRYDATLSKYLKLNTSAYLSDYSSDYDFEDTYDYNDLLEIETINNVEDKGFSVALQLAKNKENVFRLGYDYVFNNVRHDIINNYTDPDNNQTLSEEKDNDTQKVKSIFSEYVLLKNKWVFQAGLRYSKIDKIDKKVIEPRLFLKYKLNNYWKIKGSYETKNQIISKVLSINQNSLGLGNSLWVLSDENRPVLNNKQFSLGVLYEKKGWKLDVEAYYRKIKGLTALKDFYSNNSSIDFQPTPGDIETDTSSFNKGRSNSLGLDILIKKQYKNFRTWLSYSLSKTEYNFNGVNQNKDYLGNFDQTHILSLSSSYKFKNFQFSLGWNIATGTPFTPVLGINQDSFELTYGKTNSDRLKTYHKLDASIVYNFYLNKRKSVKAKLGISFINIYDRDNELEKTFRIDYPSDPFADPRIIEETSFGLGFTPNAVFRLKF